MITKTKNEIIKAKNIWKEMKPKKKIMLTVSIIIGLIGLIVEMIPLIISSENLAINPRSKIDIIGLICYILSFAIAHISEILQKPIQRLKQINEIYENYCTEEQKEQVFKLMINFKEENKKM